MKTIKERRTIRKYKQQDISSELLNDLLEASFRASTTGNMQLYSVISTRDIDKKAALSPLHYNQPAIQSAPVVLTFCADFNRFSQWCKNRKAIPGYNNFQSFMNAAIDALLVAQTFCTAAEEQGLGICYLGTTTYNAQQIIDTLQLPQLVFPITTVTVGYPDESPKQVDRLPIHAIIHEEQYQNYTTDSINEIFSHKESLPENLQFIQDNNKETLAQVFTEVRYTQKDNEFISKSLLEAIRKQGFMD